MEDKDYVYSTDNEIFNADQVEELSLEVGDTYYRAEREDVNPSDLVTEWVASEVIEKMNENFYEEVGEVAESNLNISEEAESELLQLIKDWADKHATVSCWKAINVEELTFEGYEKCAT